MAHCNTCYSLDCRSPHHRRQLCTGGRTGAFSLYRYALMYFTNNVQLHTKAEEDVEQNREGFLKAASTLVYQQRTSS